MYNISNISNKYPIYPIYPIYWRVTIKKIVFPRIKSNCRWSLLFTTTPRGVGVFFNCFQPLSLGSHQPGFVEVLLEFCERFAEVLSKTSTKDKH